MRENRKGEKYRHLAPSPIHSRSCRLTRIQIPIYFTSGMGEVAMRGALVSG